MKTLRPLLYVLALSLACNLPGRVTDLATATQSAAPTAEATLPPTPSAIPTEPQPEPPPTETAIPENPLADLTGPAKIASPPSEWPLHNSGNTVFALLPQGDILWAGTSGGIVRWDTTTGNFERFTAADGLTLTQVFDLALDDLGRLWAAGDKGLAVYDGASWGYTHQADMGLPENSPLRAVAIDTSGNVWAGGDEYFDYSNRDPFYIPAADETVGGLAHWNGDAWEVFDVVGDGMLSNQINDIAIGADGSVWVAVGQAGSEPTAGGVMRRVPGDPNWRTYGMAGGLNGFAFSDLAVDKDGAVWIAGRRGITRLTEDSSQSYDLINTLALAVAPDGTVWVGAHDGLFQLSQDALTPVNLPKININTLATTQNGDVWVGTDISLSRLAGEALEPHFTTDGPLNNSVYKVAWAADGSLWTNTPGGVSRLAGDRWEHFLAERSGVEAAYPWELNRPGLWPVDSQGGIWLIEGDRVARYDGSTWADVTPPQGQVYVIALDPNAGMWSATDTLLLHYLDGTWQTVAPLDKSEGNYGVSDILVDAQGGVWVASGVPYIDGGRVARWDGGGWTIYREADGLAGNAITDLALGPDGQIWAAHPIRGLSRFDGQKWVAEVADPRALGLDVDGFASLVFAPDGSQWLRMEAACGFEGTCFTGIAHRVGDQWTAYRAQPGGLPTDLVFDLAVSDSGQVWLGTWAGLVAMPQ